LLLSVWLLAATGISVTAAVVMPRAMRKTGASLYIVFGWLGLFLIPKLGLLNASVGRLVLAGGILYTLGTILFAIKKPFMHVGWHFFVIAAAAVQYLAILKLA
jgi:hemolysin III